MTDNAARPRPMPEIFNCLKLKPCVDIIYTTKYFPTRAWCGAGGVGCMRGWRAQAHAGMHGVHDVHGVQRQANAGRKTQNLAADSPVKPCWERKEASCEKPTLANWG